QPFRRVATAVRGPVAAVGRTPVALGLASGPTVGATARLAESPTGVKVLLAASESKRLTAVAAGQRSISRHRGRPPCKKYGSASWPTPNLGMKWAPSTCNNQN